MYGLVDTNWFIYSKCLVFQNSKINFGSMIEKRNPLSCCFGDFAVHWLAQRWFGYIFNLKIQSIFFNKFPDF